LVFTCHPEALRCYASAAIVTCGPLFFGGRPYPRPGAGCQPHQRLSLTCLNSTWCLFTLNSCVHNRPPDRFPFSKLSIWRLIPQLTCFNHCFQARNGPRMLLPPFISKETGFATFSCFRFLEISSLSSVQPSCSHQILCTRSAH